MPDPDRNRCSSGIHMIIKQCVSNCGTCPPIGGGGDAMVLELRMSPWNRYAYKIVTYNYFFHIKGARDVFSRGLYKNHNEKSFYMNFNRNF